MPDPRKRRGLRYTTVTLLTTAAAAVLAGSRSLAAVGECIADAPQQVRARSDCLPTRSPAHCTAPHAGTVRRLLQRIDGGALDAAVGAHLQARAQPQPGSRRVRRAVAVDGKTVRGSRTPAATAVQLLAAMDHHGIALAQR